MIVSDVVRSPTTAAGTERKPVKIAHDRVAMINAHFAWSLLFWGSAKCSLQSGNLLPAIIGFYYSAFHSAFSLAASDHRNHDAALRRVRHAEVEAWVQAENDRPFSVAFLFMRRARESFSYLGFPDGITRLSIVRGNPTGMNFRAKTFSYRDVAEAGETLSEWFMNECWVRAAKRLEKVEGPIRLPSRGNRAWLEEYLGEDALLSVAPETKVLAAAFQPLLSDVPPTPPEWITNTSIWIELTYFSDQPEKDSSQHVDEATKGEPDEESCC